MRIKNINRTEQLAEITLNLSEWQKLYYKHQQEYIRRRLEAIKNLHGKKTRIEVMEIVGCVEQTLISWIDIYLENLIAKGILN